MLCEDFRTISLSTYASKTILKVFHRRLEQNMETIHFRRGDQFELRRGRGRRDGTGVLMAVNERTVEHDKLICVLFFRLWEIVWPCQLDQINMSIHVPERPECMGRQRDWSPVFILVIRAICKVRSEAGSISRRTKQHDHYPFYTKGIYHTTTKALFPLAFPIPFSSSLFLSVPSPSYHEAAPWNQLLGSLEHFKFPHRGRGQSPSWHRLESNLGGKNQLKVIMYGFLLPCIKFHNCIHHKMHNMIMVLCQCHLWVDLKDWMHRPSNTKARFLRLSIVMVIIKFVHKIHTFVCWSLLLYL